MQAIIATELEKKTRRATMSAPLSYLPCAEDDDSGVTKPIATYAALCCFPGNDAIARNRQAR
jgi:hypothetical protein